MVKLITLLLCGLISVLATSCSRQQAPPEEDLTIMNAAEEYGRTMSRTLKKSRTIEITANLRNDINEFHLQEGRYPRTLQELVEKNYINNLPELPEGMSYHYDPSTGRIEAR